MSLRNIMHYKYSYLLEKCVMLKITKKPRQRKTGQHQARQDKTRRHPDKMMPPGFEKYCIYYLNYKLNADLAKLCWQKRLCVIGAILFAILILNSVLSPRIYAVRYDTCRHGDDIAWENVSSLSEKK